MLVSGKSPKLYLLCHLASLLICLKQYVWHIFLFLMIFCFSFNANLPEPWNIVSRFLCFLWRAFGTNTAFFDPLFVSFILYIFLFFRHTFPNSILLFFPIFLFCIFSVFVLFCLTPHPRFPKRTFESHWKRNFFVRIMDLVFRGAAFLLFRSHLVLPGCGCTIVKLTEESICSSFESIRKLVFFHFEIVN